MRAVSGRHVKFRESGCRPALLGPPAAACKALPCTFKLGYSAYPQTLIGLIPQSWLSKVTNAAARVSGGTAKVGRHGALGKVVSTRVHLSELREGDGGRVVGENLNVLKLGYNIKS